jgi:hypothetical protein
MSLTSLIESPGPHRLLALDGGGIRGMISIEVLGEIEEILRREQGGDDSFVLADYFDYVAGTSTGAIIATCIAMGMTVAQIREFYQANGPAMFDKASFARRFRYKFEDERLSEKLREVLGGDTTLGTDRLRTLLMVVMRNAMTDSPWLITNNPRAMYNEPERANCNLRLPLWQLVRASTAAPVYFPPEVVKIGEKEFIFVDGGITTYNNPAFMLFLMSTIEPYRLGWPTGEKNLLLVSIGTGSSPNVNEGLKPEQMNLLFNAGHIPGALMYAALNEQDLLCRTFGRCLAGDPIDREVGTMIGVSGPVQPKLFTYVRYNAELSRVGLDELGLRAIDPKSVQKLDSVEFMDELQQVGRAVARAKVRREHFADFLPRAQVA